VEQRARRRLREAFVYIMSNKSHRLYTGVATDLVNRVLQHKSGSYPNGFTARYHFDRLVYFETLPSFAAGVARERQVKGWTRAKRVAIIQRDNPNWLDLSAKFDDLLSAR
jgi:putative endonuclease